MPEIAPAIAASDAEEAKETPWSSARKKTTGAEVRGSPMSQPLMVEPHRRPARLAAVIKAGVVAIFRIRVSIHKCAAWITQFTDYSSKQYF
jgi:hypothetical protein